MPKPRLRRILPIPLLLILAGYILYAAGYIYRTSFVIDGERYFSLFDDAMISMRYAANLAHGYGLVWNPGGPRIEGYTNLLWVLYMAAWHLLPITPAKISLGIQGTAVGLLLLNLCLVYKIANRLVPHTPLVSYGSVVLTALYLPLNTWSLQGMEVAVLTPLLSLAAWWVLDGLTTPRSWLGLYGLLAVGTLIRLDMVVPLLAILAFLLVTDRGRRKEHLLYGAAALGLGVGLQTAFRLFYYGDLLPNTYYLKLTGYPLLPRVQHGVSVFIKFVASMNVVLFALPWLAVWSQRNKYVYFLCWLFWGQVAYSVYVGGDAWEYWGGSNRYFSPVMPLFMVLLCYSLYLYLQRIASSPLDASTARRMLNVAMFSGLLCATAMFAYLGGTALSTLPLTILASLVILPMLFTVGVIYRARRIPGAEPALPGRTYYVTWVGTVLLALSLVNLNAIYRPHSTDEWLLLVPPLHVLDNKWVIEQAQVLNQLTDPDAQIAVVWAGAGPYFANRPMIDLLGKNDRTIAHEPVHPAPGTEAYQNFRPGHMKWDYAYALGQLQPDVVAQLWPDTPSGSALTLQAIPPDAQPYLAAGYRRVQVGNWIFYVRINSPHIHWEMLTPS